MVWPPLSNTGAMLLFGVAQMHQWQRCRTIAVDEIDLGGRVFRNGFEGFERLQFHVVGIFADGFVDLGDLVGLSIGEQATLFGLGLGSILFGNSKGDLLLLFGVVAFEFGFLLLDFLLALFLGLDGLGDEGWQLNVANQHG